MIKTKNITLCLLTTILTIFVIGVVSAASLDVIGTPVIPAGPLNHNAGSFQITFDLRNSGLAASLIPSTLMTSGQISSVTINKNSIGDGSTTPVTETITATLSFQSYQSGNLNGKLIITPSGSGSPEEISFNIPITSVSSLEVSTPTTLTQSQNSTFIITNKGNTVITPVVNVDPITYDSKTLTVTSSPSPLTALNPGATQTITLTATIPSNEESLLDGATTSVRITATGIADIIKTLNVESSYCEIGSIGNLEIDRIKFTNNGRFGDKNDWYLTDEIEVEVKVNNNNADEKIKDVIVAWGLYDKSTGNFVVEDEESSFNLDKKGQSNDDKTITFTFVIDPNDFDTDFSESDFEFLVKAYSDDLGENVQCNSMVEKDITIRKDNDLVILDNIVLLSDNIPCKGILEGNFDVWNIGDSSEDDISVRVFNTELGIDDKIKIGSLDVLEDKSSVDFRYNIPQNAIEKSYVLNFEVLDEYGDVFESDDNDLAEFASKSFQVSGSCQAQAGVLLITANLDSETPTAVAGKQVIVNAVLKNQGNAESTYIVSIEGNSGWSSLTSVNPNTVTLAPGESKTVSIILRVNDDASGENEFTIKANYNGQVTEQPVILTVGLSSGGQTTDLGPFVQHISDNWFIYLIIIVNLILIIAIILVVRRMLSPGVPM